MSAANTGFAVYATNAATATGYGIYAAVTGASNTGYAGYFSNTATTGYAFYANGTMGAAGVSGAASPTSSAANYSEMTGNSNNATVAAASTVYGPANGAFTMSATVPSATAKRRDQHGIARSHSPDSLLSCQRRQWQRQDEQDHSLQKRQRNGADLLGHQRHNLQRHLG